MAPCLRVRSAPTTPVIRIIGPVLAAVTPPGEGTAPLRAQPQWSWEASAFAFSLFLLHRHQHRPLPATGDPDARKYLGRLAEMETRT